MWLGGHTIQLGIRLEGQKQQHSGEDSSLTYEEVSVNPLHLYDPPNMTSSELKGQV